MKQNYGPLGCFAIVVCKQQHFKAGEHLLAVGSLLVLSHLWLLALLDFAAFLSDSCKGLGGFLLPKEHVTHLTGLSYNLLTCVWSREHCHRHSTHLGITCIRFFTCSLCHG